MKCWSTSTSWSSSSGPQELLSAGGNQEEYFDPADPSLTIVESSFCATLVARHLVESFSKDAVAGRSTLGGNTMSGQVILYFEDQTDALRFALAAGSVMAGDGPNATDLLLQETARVTRIRLDAANAGKALKSSPPERAA
jgi:hypothetical protein